MVQRCCFGVKVTQAGCLEAQRALTWCTKFMHLPVNLYIVLGRYSGEPVERLLEFVPIFSHTGQSLADKIYKTLWVHNIGIKGCHGQAYDNVSNMSGKYKGVQTHIQNINPLAEYIPCTAHSLNLVRQLGVSVCSCAAKKLYGSENNFFFDP